MKVGSDIEAERDNVSETANQCPRLFSHVISSIRVLCYLIKLSNINTSRQSRMSGGLKPQVYIHAWYGLSSRDMNGDAFVHLADETCRVSGLIVLTYNSQLNNNHDLFVT